MGKKKEEIIIRQCKNFVRIVIVLFGYSEENAGGPTQLSLKDLGAKKGSGENRKRKTRISSEEAIFGRRGVAWGEKNQMRQSWPDLQDMKPN